MKRWSERDSDSARLPHGVRRVAYDADTQVYTYRDGNGRVYEGAPGARYGVLMPRRKEENPYPTAKAYLEAHPETYDDANSKQGGGRAVDDDEKTLVGRIVSPTKAMIRSVSKSSHVRPLASSTSPAESRAGSKELSTSEPTTPTRSVGRLRAKSATSISRMSMLARSLTGQLARRGEQEQLSSAGEVQHNIPADSIPSLDGLAGGPKRASVPRRVQTMRDYIQHGRDERCLPPAWKEPNIAADPWLKRRETK